MMNQQTMWSKLPQHDTKSIASDFKVVIHDTAWTVKRGLYEVTAPVIVALGVMLPVYVFTNHLMNPPISMEERVAQLPVTRSFPVAIRTVNKKNLIATVTGRQIANYESDNWCEYAWAGKIAEVAAKSGTIHVDGNYHIDDFVAQDEYGFEAAIESDLTGLTLKSDNCIFGILSVELEVQ